MEEIRQIVCPSCGAEYEDTLPKCPYCDLMNYKGAEKEYLNKLEDMREDMDQLAQVPENTAKEELKKQSKLLRRILITVAIIVLLSCAGRYVYYEFDFGGPSQKEQFLWEAENFPKFDAMYEAGEYEKLADAIYESLGGEYNTWNYGHRDFALCYGSVIDAKKQIEQIEAWEDVDEGTYVSLFCNEFDVLYEWDLEEMSEEERAIIEVELAIIEEDFFTRWEISEEVYLELRQKAADNYDILSYDDAKKFVKEWLKERK